MSIQVLDPFCGGFWRCPSFIITPTLVVLAMHHHLKIDFKPVTTLTGGVMGLFLLHFSVTSSCQGASGFSGMEWCTGMVDGTVIR